MLTLEHPTAQYSATDHHWMIAQQPPMTQEQADHSDILYRARWQSLLSVDDVVAAIAGAVDKAGATSHTFFVYTSDHGYSLGELNLNWDKRNVYE